jgi:hypothetical protein
LSLIPLPLSISIFQEVLLEKTEADMWLKLVSICMSNDLTNKKHVNIYLFSHKLQEDASVMNHISIFREITSDLLLIEVKYEDEHLAFLMLVSFPSSFTIFGDTIL